MNNTLKKTKAELYAEVNNIFNPRREDCAELRIAILEAVESQKIDVARLLRNYALVAFPRAPALIQLSPTLGTDYDQQFYSRLEAGSESSAKVILKIVQDRFQFRSVVDFGTGTGVWLKAAHAYGASTLLGIDGPWAQHLKRFHAADYRFINLNDSVPELKSYDVAICVEVAEHLEPSRSISLVSDLCQLADAVVFGAALTRQFGDGHINCRNQSFWITLFRDHGFSCHDIFRPKIWYDSRVEPWYRQNTFLFTRGKISDLFRDFAEPVLLDLYQPSLLFHPVDFYVKRDHQMGPPSP